MARIMRPASGGDLWRNLQSATSPSAALRASASSEAATCRSQPARKDACRMRIGSRREVEPVEATPCA
eukprot:13538202-Heterocapsa_arctica.AAC.1